MNAVDGVGLSRIHEDRKGGEGEKAGEMREDLGKKRVACVGRIEQAQCPNVEDGLDMCERGGVRGHIV